MRFSFLTVGLLAAGLLLTASTTEAATPVACGDTLTVPGQYYLAGDIICNSPNGTPAVRIAADDVHFNLGGHRITEGSGNFAGIEVGDCLGDSTSTLSGIHITNGIVDGFDYGIFACRTSDLKITNVELINSITALNLVAVNGGDINASAFVAEYEAVVLRGSHDNRFHANRLSSVAGEDCRRGYSFENSSYNIVTGNEISDCNDAGVLLQASSNGNIVRGNVITGSGNFGVLAFGNASGNIIQANRVKGFATDLRDYSNTCDNNTWKANQFATASPGCLK